MDSPFDAPMICGGTPCCGESPCIDRDVVLHNATKGRKKRKRRPGSGSAVKVGGHTRSPRGANRGKTRVRVDGYKRGKSPKKKRKR